MSDANDHGDADLPDPSARGAGRWLRHLLIASVVLAALLPRLLAIFTESINWDEFALLQRVEQTLLEGRVVGGGRPGLVNLMLVPFLKDCTDVVTTAVRVRLLWLGITSVFLCGVFFLVRNWYRFARREDPGSLEASVAVMLLAFHPTFVVWSLQVRTDQVALAAATWGGVLLLSDRRWFALLAGALCGLAVLSTQKGVYIAALAGLLWASAIAGRLRGAARQDLQSELRNRSTQALVSLAGALIVIGAYALLVPLDAALANSKAVAGAWDSMRRVREIAGYRAYVAAATQALPHALILAGLAASTIAQVFARDPRETHLLATCWSVLMLGAVVAFVHGSSWAYFVMTLGLFAAVALGMASGHLARRLGRNGPAILGLLLFAVVVGSVPVTLEMLRGSQSHQRDTLRWIRESGLGSYHGYQIDGALVCTVRAAPMPSVSHLLNIRGLSEQQVEGLIDQFRRRPIAYVIDADRLPQLPQEVRRFLREHYVWHYGAVSVAGFKIRDEGRPSVIDVIVPGRYVWNPGPRSRAAILELPGASVRPGDIVSLGVGRLEYRTLPSPADGTLLLALGARVGLEPYPFVDPVQVDRLVGAD